MGIVIEPGAIDFHAIEDEGNIWGKYGNPLTPSSGDRP